MENDKWETWKYEVNLIEVVNTFRLVFLDSYLEVQFQLQLVIYP